MYYGQFFGTCCSPTAVAPNHPLRDSGATRCFNMLPQHLSERLCTRTATSHGDCPVPPFDGRPRSGSGSFPGRSVRCPHRSSPSSTDVRHRDTSMRKVKTPWPRTLPCSVDGAQLRATVRLADSHPIASSRTRHYRGDVTAHASLGIVICRRDPHRPPVALCSTRCG